MLRNSNEHFLGRPERQFRTGLCFTRDVSFFLFRHAFSEYPRPIALKLCHMVGIWLYFLIPLQKFGGGALNQKNLGAKNMQNFGQFWTTSDFDREYLRNGWRYPKSASVTTYGNSSCVQRKRSGELWSTNGLEFHVSLDPLKMHFFGILYRDP